MLSDAVRSGVPFLYPYYLPLYFKYLITEKGAELVSLSNTTHLLWKF